MRIVATTIGMVLALSACGDLIEGERAGEGTDAQRVESETTATSEAPATTTKKQQRKAAARAQRQTEQFIDDCVQYVPTMADLGEELSAVLWADAGQKKRALRATCTQIAESRPRQRTLIEQMIVEARDFLAGTVPATTYPPASTTSTPTTVAPPIITIAPTTAPAPTAAPAATTTPGAPATTSGGATSQNSIAVSCPPQERQDGSVFRARFSVSTSGPSPIVEWGMDYGDGQSGTTASRASADAALYVHDYLSKGTYNVTAWIVDDAGRRSSDSCTAVWTAS